LDKVLIVLNPGCTQFGALRSLLQLVLLLSDFPIDETVDKYFKQAKADPQTAQAWSPQKILKPVFPQFFLTEAPNFDRNFFLDNRLLIAFTGAGIFFLDYGRQLLNVLEVFTELVYLLG
jgi:hypothetical protein